MTDHPSDDGHREVTQQQLYNTINNNDKITEAVSNYLHYYHDQGRTQEFKKGGAKTDRA